MYLSNRTVGQLQGEIVKVLARFTYKKRWIVLIAWILLMIGMTGLSNSVGSAFSSSFSLPNTESSKVFDVLKKELPAQGGDSSQIVFEGTAPLTSPVNQQKITELVDSLKSKPYVASVESPFEGPSKSLSKDEKIGFATLYFKETAQNISKEDVKDLISYAKSYESKTLAVNLSGQAIKQANQVEPSSSEVIAILAAFVVLLFTFGSFVATLIPLIVAVFALAIGNSSVSLASNLMGIAEFAPTLAALVGLGVGIDYALFIVTRFRRSLFEGLSVEESVVKSLNTSGRSVLFAGIIVCISMLGLITVGVSFLNGVGVAAALSVFFSMAAALTLLPAVLSIVGKNIDRLRIPFKKLHQSTEGGEGWRAWAEKIQEKPLKWGVSASLVLLILCIPATQIRLGLADSGNDQAGTTTRIAYDTLAKGFGPGYNGPITLLADMSNSKSGNDISGLVQAISKDEDVAQVLPAIPTKDGRYQIINFYPKSSPQAEETTDLIKRLRSTVLPSVAKDTGIITMVGGSVATYEDFGSLLTSKLPQFISTVVLLSFLLLMLLFRSILIPIKAAIMNLLSIAAAFGVVVAGFQWGWFEPIFGTPGGPIESFLPIMLFAILFGLSMDYEVFLVSRIHEEWLKSGNSKDAISKGLAATGSIITAAASIMIVVFFAFVFLGERTIQLFGVGLASAVLIDATIIRSTLVPAFMQLTAKWNWYFPKSLDKRLPRIHLEE